MNHVMSTFLNTPIQNNRQHYSKEVYTKESKFEEKFDSARNKKNENISKTDVKRESCSSVLQKTNSILEKVTTPRTDDKVTQEEALEIMMQLIMSMLNLSSDDVEKILNKQGILIEDLANEDTFRAFAMETLQTDELTLLNDQDQMAVIKQLWEGLKVINQTTHKNEEIIKQTLLIKNGEVTQEVIQKFNTDVLGEEQSAALAEGVADISKPRIDSEKVEGQTIAGKYRVSSSNALELGLTVPIQAVTQVQPNQLWKEVKGQNMLYPNHELNNPVHTQLLEKIHYAQIQSGKELTMELSPKELGKLALKMVEQNGLVTAQIKVEQDRTKELILQNIEQLKEGFEKQGLTISDVQVEVKKDPHHTHMEKEKQKSTKRIQELILKHMEETELEEATEKVGRDNLTSAEVDYKA